MEAFNLAVANEDHNIYIFDVRKMSHALNVLKGRWSQSVVPFSASESNYKVYSRTCRLHFDVYADSASYLDHVAAVMDVSFSPTGEELVSASYDRTIRIFSRAGGHSRDVYHTKR